MRHTGTFDACGSSHASRARDTGAAAVGAVLRFRAAATATTVAEPAQPAAADPPDGEAAPAELDESGSTERRAIRDLSLQDAALRTLRLAEQPRGRGTVRERKPAATATAARKKRKEHESESDPDDSASDDDETREAYSAALRKAVRAYQGPDGAATFTQALSRHYEKRGLEARAPALCRRACMQALTRGCALRAQLAVPPTFVDAKLDLHKLFVEVAAAGGAVAVTDASKWKRVAGLLLSGGEVPSGASSQLRKKYDTLLSSFERRCAEKHAAAVPAK